MSEDTFTRNEILRALSLEPCHVTGAHTPNHHCDWTCDTQRAAAFRRVLDLLGVNENELPRALHDSCIHCHSITVQDDDNVQYKMVSGTYFEPDPRPAPCTEEASFIDE